MCLVLDTNRFGDALPLSDAPTYEPLHSWLTREDGVVVYGGVTYKAEIARVPKAVSFLRELWRAGRARDVDLTIPGAVDAEEARLIAEAVCVSDDPHVIALVRVSGARVVCTEDVALMTDLKKKLLVDRPRGRVYRDASHAHLLHHDTSCAGTSHAGSSTSRGGRPRRKRGP